MQFWIIPMIQNAPRCTLNHLDTIRRTLEDVRSVQFLVTSRIATVQNRIGSLISTFESRPETFSRVRGRISNIQNCIAMIQDCIGMIRRIIGVIQNEPRCILNHRGDPECTALVVKEVNRGARGHLFLTRRREDAKGRREENVRKPVNISLLASFAASREMVLSFSRCILNHRDDPDCIAVVITEVNREDRPPHVVYDSRETVLPFSAPSRETPDVGVTPRSGRIRKVRTRLPRLTPSASPRPRGGVRTA